MTKKKIFGIAAFLIFAAAAIFSFKKIYDALKWKDTLGRYSSSADQLYSTEDNLVDVVFVGSSHCYNSYYPAFLWRDYGYSAFDMTTSGQDRDSSYHYLKEILKTQNPKVVFVELYGLTFDKHDIAGNIYRNLLSMKTSANSIGLVMDYVGKNGDREDIIDYVARMPIIHTRYRELERNDFIPSAINSYGRGASYSYDVENIGVYGTSDPGNPNLLLSDDKIAWLDKLCDLSREKNFDLVFLVSPYQIYGADISYMLRASEYAQERGIPFFDFNRIGGMLGIDFSTDFSDAKHTNSNGALKLTSFVGNYLAENYELTDHRGDEAYWQWDADLEYYEKGKRIYEMETTGNVLELAGILAGMKDVTAVISLEGRYGENFSDEYYGFFNALGVNPEGYTEGGKWIYKDGGLTRVASNDMEAEPYYYELGKYDTLRIRFEGDFIFPENIMIGDKGYGNIGCCLAVLVYDEVTGETVIHRGF